MTKLCDIVIATLGTIIAAIAAVIVAGLIALAIQSSNDNQAAACEAKGGAAIQTINGGTACVPVIK